MIQAKIWGIVISVVLAILSFLLIVSISVDLQIGLVGRWILMMIWMTVFWGLVFAFLHAIIIERKVAIDDDELPAEWREQKAPWREPTDLGFIEKLKRQLQWREAEAIASIKEDIRLESCKLLGSKIHQKNDFYTVEWIFGLQVVHRLVANDSQKWIDQVRRRRVEIDRLYAGYTREHITDLKVSIEKAKRRRQDCTGADKKKEALNLDEEIIDLQHELAEVERFTADLEAGKRPHPVQAGYEGDRFKNTYDIRYDIFKSFESYVFKDIETRKVYNEWLARIDSDPSLTPQQKKELKDLLEERFTEAARKAGQTASNPKVRVFKAGA